MKELPRGWAWTTLGEIAHLQGGLTKGKKRKDGDRLRSVPYLRVENVQRGYLNLDHVKLIEATEAEIEDLSLRVGDVLFNEGGDRDKLGRGWVWQRDLPECIHQNHVFRARLRTPDIQPKFVSLYGNSEGATYFNDQGKQTTNLASINLAKLSELPVPLPPASEQTRIVAGIERLFSNVEAAQASLCAAQKKLRMHDASTLNRVFRSGHPLRRIGDIFNVYVGSTPSRSVPEYWGGGIPWASSGEVAFCRVATTRETISPLGLANSSVKVHPPGTVLLGMIGEGKTRGQAAILDIEAGNNQNSAAIRVSEAGYPPEYLFWFLVREYERTRTIGSGNNQPALNKSRVQDMRFPLAPLPEQIEVVATLEQAMSVTSSLKQALSACLARATALRQAILKKAFEGKLVPQDPNDEPASILLERIRAALAQPPGRRALRKREVHA